MQSKDVEKMSEDGDEMPIWLHWPAAIIFSIVGMIFFSMITINTFAQLETEEWYTTTGIVEDYDLFCDYDGEGGCVTEEYIEYIYTVDGISYRNNVVNLGWTPIEYQWYMSLGLTNGVTLEDGDEIEVYYNPYDPQKCVLIPGWDGIEFGDFFVLFFTMTVSCVLLITARRKGKLSDAWNELQELLGMAKEFQGIMPQNHQHQWNGEQWEPIQGHNLQVSSNVGKGGISPSRTRGYNSVIAKLSLGGGQMTEEMVKSKLQTELDLSQKDAQKFVDSPYVRSVIFPNNFPIEQTTPSNIEDDLGEQNLTNAFENKLISNFQAAMQDAMEEQEKSTNPKTTLDSNVDTCSHDGCNSVMTFYSFQCFSCRKKFCEEHKGASIHCADCA